MSFILASRQGTIKGMMGEQITLDMPACEYSCWSATGMTPLSLNCGIAVMRVFTQQTCFHKSLRALAAIRNRQTASGLKLHCKL